METCRDCGKEVYTLYWGKCERCEFYLGIPCRFCGGASNERKTTDCMCLDCRGK